MDYDTERVNFPRGLVERFIADAPKIDWDHPVRRVHGSAGVYEGFYHDPGLSGSTHVDGGGEGCAGGGYH